MNSTNDTCDHSHSTIINMVLLLVFLSALTSCYRLVRAPSLAHHVQLRVIPDPTLPLLSPAVSGLLSRELGQQFHWTMHPTGNAILVVTLKNEPSRIQASSDQDIPRRWQRPVNVQWTLSQPDLPSQSGTFTIQSHYSSLAEEGRMVDRLAQEISDRVIDQIWVQLTVDNE